MANMIKFYRGLLENLPATGENGALYITTNEGAIYYGTGTGMKRLGDFVQVDAVANLPTAGANTSSLYYCVAENILAKWTGSEWQQVNKQKTLAELGGVAQSAYDTKIAALEQADTDNATAISGVDTRLQAAEEKLKSVATTEGLGELTDRVTIAEGEIDALQEASHTHTFADADVEDAISKKHSHTFADADVVDAISKKHAHTFVESELNKIVEGDVAKWNGVAADHLTSTDKTNLENAIKEAKKAGTDANTNIETYKVTNDARVKAVEEDVAEIVDGTNGILAQAKSYSDGKLATARTEITAEIDADVKVVADELAGYKTSNDAALAGVKATADAAAVKTEVETALGGKVDKVEGKELIATSEIERLATLHNYDDTQVKADIAKKADAEAMTTELGKKVDKVEGYSLVADTEITRLAGVHNYDDTALAGRVTTAEGKITALEGASATHATKSELEAVDAKFANYKTAEAQKAIDDEQDRRLGVIEGDYLKAADIAEFETKANVKKVADDLAAYIESNDTAVADRYTKTEADGKFAVKGEDAYDDTEVRGLISDNADAIAAETERATGIEGGLRTDVDAIKADYLKAADKIELEGKISANATAIEVLTNGIDAEKIDGLNDLVEWANEHAPEVASIKEDIEANTKAITDEAGRADAAEKVLAGRLDVLEAIDHDAYIAADSALKAELQKEIDDDVKAAIDAEVLRADGAYDTKGAAAAAQAAAEATAAAAIAAAKEEAANQDAVVLAEAQKGISEVQTVLETYKTNNDAAVALKANAADVFTKPEVEAMLTWGSF